MATSYRGQDADRRGVTSKHDAVAVAEEQVSPTPAGRVPSVETGIRLYREGRYQEALAELRGVVAVDDNLRNRYALAVVLYGGLGRSAEAVEVLTEAMRIAPTSVQANELLGTVWLSLDRADSAETVLAHAVILAPENWQLRNLLGLAHLRQGDLASAEGAFRAAVLRAPWEPHPHLNLAQIHARQGDTSASAWEHSAFERLEELQKDAEWYEDEMARETARGLATPRLHVLLGRAYLKQGRYNLSTAQFAQAIRLDCSFGLAYYGMGATYHFQGRLDLAIEAYERAIAADSGLVLVLNDLGRAYQQAGRRHEATATLRKAAQLRPDLEEVEPSVARPRVVSPGPGREQLFSP